jgi:hypothetical protein
LLREETWVALNPDKIYDTLAIEDVDHPDHYKTVIVKNEGVAIKDGIWKFFDPMTGTVARTENWELGKLQKSQAAKRAFPDSTQAVANFGGGDRRKSGVCVALRRAEAGQSCG